MPEAIDGLAAGGASFGARLRRARLAAGLTQEELAERAGLSARGIQDLERGLRATPQRETVRRLAAALGVPPGEAAARRAAGARRAAPAGVPRSCAADNPKKQEPPPARPGIRGHRQTRSH